MAEYNNIRLQKRTFDLIKQLATEEQRTMTVLVERMANEYSAQHQGNKKPEPSKSMSG
jgi:predicted DNA-binding ribbon-helix-helix protein